MFGRHGYLLCLETFRSFPAGEDASSGMWLHFAVDEFAAFACGAHQFEVELQAQPEAGRGAEVAAEAQVVFGCATPLRFLHVGEVGRGDACHAGNLGLRDVPLVQGFAECFGEEVHQGKQFFLSFHGVQC